MTHICVIPSFQIYLGALQASATPRWHPKWTRNEEMTHICVISLFPFYLWWHLNERDMKEWHIYVSFPYFFCVWGCIWIKNNWWNDAYMCHSRVSFIADVATGARRNKEMTHICVISSFPVSLGLHPNEAEMKKWHIYVSFPDFPCLWGGFWMKKIWRNDIYISHFFISLLSESWSSPGWLPE